jgi:hypothetical protein
MTSVASQLDFNGAISQSIPSRLVIRPLFGPREGIDVTGAVVDAIAASIGSLHRGNEVLNRLEAERLFEDAWARERRRASEQRLA